MNSYFEIDKSALYHNIELIRSNIDVAIIGVVKFDGYGLSLETAVEIWRSVGVKLFAVSTPQEAIKLRKLCTTEDILLLTPICDRETLSQMIENGIILTVTSLGVGNFYAENSKGLPLRVHIAVDVGMGRFGVYWWDIEQLERIYNIPCFIYEGIFSHFSKSFEKNYKITQKQLNRFKYAVNSLIKSGCKVGVRHIANSCAALRFPETHLDAVRIGSALTGRLPYSSSLGFKDAGCFRAKVVDVKYFQKGDTVGYGSTYKCKRNIKAAIVSIGYENGFGYEKITVGKIYRFVKYILHEKPCVFFKENKLPLVGKIGNQYTLFDTNGTDIKIGDEVVVKIPLLFPHNQRICK